MNWAPAKAIAMAAFIFAVLIVVALTMGVMQ